MNLYQKLVEVRKAVTFLKKENQGFQYSYVSSSQALYSIRQKMDELGVLLIPRVKEKTVERIQSENDRGRVAVQFFTTLAMEYEWINADNPEERIVCPWYSQGIDTGEKGVGKAYTYGEKYFVLKFFNIPTDKDDPDAHQERPDKGATKVAAPKKAGEPGGSEYQEPQQETKQDGSMAVLALTDVREHSGVSQKTQKPYSWFEVMAEDGRYFTFNRNFADIARDSMARGEKVKLSWKTNERNGKDILYIEPAFGQAA